MFACVAQLVEHFLGKEEVTGSIPVASSSAAFIKILEHRRERYYHFGMYRLQEKELFHNEEQEETNRTS
jgi:tRNA A37 threonylcarbamoyladenosine biosynthesis protein TsaE